MAITQAEKAERFRELHLRAGAFVIPNPWDAGTARILTSLGYEALTTTSAGLAFSLGRRDQAGLNSRDEALSNAKSIVDATDLPVAADLESGYGDDPGDVAETIRLAGVRAGLVGASIEDSRSDPAHPIYDLGQAVERIAAAVQAARSLPYPFMLVARAENYLFGRRDLDDTIRRLQAFESAGADVLYAPGVSTAEEIRTLCTSVGKPVNVLMTAGSAPLTVDELAELGVKRISVGAALCRVALGAMLDAAREIKEQGTFEMVRRAIPFTRLNELMVDRRD